MSYLILHNGNRLVKNWMADCYGCDPVASLADEWTKGDTFIDRVKYAQKNLVCTELSVADQISKLDLCMIKDSFRITKVITSYDNDIANLQPAWCSKLQNWINDYRQIKDANWPDCDTVEDLKKLPEHIKKECKDVFGLDPIYDKDSNDIECVSYNDHVWKISLFHGLTLADQLIFWDPVSFPDNRSLPKIVFTPGRSGTHILKNISGIDEHVHHYEDILKNTQRLDVLINAEKILAVLRDRLIDQVVSETIGRHYNTMVTDSENYQENQKLVAKWQPIEVTENDIQLILASIIDYTDHLIGLHLFYNKKIEFSIMEDLVKIHGSKIKNKKNPYHHHDMVSNYEQIVTQCDKEYQAIYDKITSKLISLFGKQLYIK